MSDLACVKSFNDRSGAEIAQAVLAGNGIASLVDADDAGGAWPGFGLAAGGVRLLVAEENREVAQEALEEIRGPTDP